MFVLSDAEVALVGKAFDRAWDGFLRTGALTPENLCDSRNLLAARILRAVYYGERDEWRLARDAVSYLRQVIGSMPGRPKGQQGFAQRPSRGRMKASARRGRRPEVATPGLAEIPAEGAIAAIAEGAIAVPPDCSGPGAVAPDAVAPDAVLPTPCEPPGAPDAHQSLRA